MGQHGDVDARINELARPQHGVVARSQLLEAGVSAGVIGHRLRKGTLRPVHRGVYRTGPITARYQREMAAALACGRRAALCDRTAAGIWGMLPSLQPEAPVDVAVPRALRGPASGVRLHLRSSLQQDEVTERHRLPLTTAARTIVDLAAALGPYELERVLALTLRRQVASREAVEVMLVRHPRRRGSRVLRTLLEDAAGPVFTRSEAEARFLSLLRKGHVPRPQVNAVVSGLEVDFFWPDRGVVVEVDGFAHHAHRSAFENDRRRDGILAAERLAVLRFTWRQINSEPEQVLVRLAMALGARAPDPNGRSGVEPSSMRP